MYAGYLTFLHILVKIESRVNWLNNPFVPSHFSELKLQEETESSAWRRTSLLKRV